MKLLQTTQLGLQAAEGMTFLIVESQEYGQPSDFRYNVIVNNQTATRLILSNPDSWRVIKDTGRTIGFWQRIGAKGIYKVSLVPLQGFADNVIKILKNCKEAKIGYSGKTWKSIIKSMPFMPSVLEGLGVNQKK